MATNARKPKATPRVNRAPVLPVRDNIHFPGLVHTLIVGRELSLQAVRSALAGNRRVVVVGQVEVGIDDPSPQDLFGVGTLSELIQALPMPDGTMRAVLRGIARVRLDDAARRRGILESAYSLLLEQPATGKRTEALRREALEAYHRLFELSKHMPAEAIEAVNGLSDAGTLCDTMAHHLSLKPAQKQRLLEELDSAVRLGLLLGFLSEEREVLELQRDIRIRVEAELGGTHREYFLREQLRAIQNELNERAPLSEEGQELLRRIEACHMPPDVHEKSMQELGRLERCSGSSPEGVVIRNYLDWLIAIPWGKRSEEKVDVRATSAILNREHYGLASVNERVLDLLAVRELNPGARSPILCFVGPPGVGKTSIARSIAKAMGRNFVRISLGGVRDEAEIRGHRRTYIGSMPGRIVQGLRQCGAMNPIMLLDEIDKLGNDLRGDPMAALLEALDPEQNMAFSDHYIELPVDLSNVMFITTANTLGSLSHALLDRMEVIPFSSYTEEEKAQIARKHLIPRVMREHGLSRSNFRVASSGLLKLIREYTRESGVRSLNRELSALARKVARSVVEGRSEPVPLDRTRVESLLGQPRYRPGTAAPAAVAGAATGLVVTDAGGDVITIEATITPTNAYRPSVDLTGCLGEVMKESALTAVTYVRANRAQLGVPDDEFGNVHIHVPEGAVPKEGPSAGITIAIALLSALSERPVKANVALTGEITLQGRVLPVGGVKEKVLAAKRAGIKHVVVPRLNEPDLQDVPASVARAMCFHLVDSVMDVAAFVLPSRSKSNSR